MAGRTGERHACYYPLHMFAGAIAVVAVDARQDWADVESDVIVLSGVRIKWVDNSMAAAAVGTGTTGCGAGAAFQRTGYGGVAGVAVVFMNIDK